jgi:hypothetical protein
MTAEKADLKVEKIFDLIMADKNLNKQDFAAYIGYDSSKMSQKFGVHWDMHWRVFVKLLPDLVRLKIIDLKELIAMSDKCEQIISKQKGPKTSKSQDNSDENSPPINPIMLPKTNFSFMLH